MLRGGPVKGCTIATSVGRCCVHATSRIAINNLSLSVENAGRMYLCPHGSRSNVRIVLQSIKNYAHTYAATRCNRSSGASLSARGPRTATLRGSARGSFERNDREAKRFDSRSCNNHTRIIYRMTCRLSNERERERERERFTLPSPLKKKKEEEKREKETGTGAKLLYGSFGVHEWCDEWESREFLRPVRDCIRRNLIAPRQTHARGTAPLTSIVPAR